jgi:subtilisin family serine protease
VKAKKVLEDLPMTPSRAPEETDSIIVKYKDGTSDTKKGNIEKGERLKKKSDIPQLNVVVYDVDADDTGREVAERMKLKNLKDVEFVEVDMLYAPAAYTPNDPYYGSEWHIPKTATDVAWNSSKGEGVTIAILDTGTNCAHPDLAASCVSGWNTASNNGDSSDINGHGTLTAGTAASIGDNAQGGVGVAFLSKIMPIRITNDPTGYASCSAISNGVMYAADHGIKVASNSYYVIGCNLISSASDYMASKGGVYVRAAGNAGILLTEVNTVNDVIVSATDSNDVRKSWSNYGSTIDISAPGEPIYCTSMSGGYGNCWGTSFSVPIVSGVLGLIYSVNPTLTAAQAKNILFSTADDLGPTGWDIEYGWGRVNAARAVSMAAGATGGNVVDTVPPSTPTNLASSNLTSSQVTLSWNQSIDTVGVAGYDVYRNSTKLTTVAGTPYTNTGLSGDASYTYTVTARDAAGNTSSSSNPVSITTLTAPLSITGSAVTAKTGTTATIGVSVNKASTITVKYGLTSTAFTSTASSPTANTSHSVSLTNLKAKSKYFYQVTATSATGETTTSPVSNFRTGVR